MLVNVRSLNDGVDELVPSTILLPEETIKQLLANAVELLVPPEAIGKMPVISLVKSINADVSTLLASNLTGKLAVAYESVNEFVTVKSATEPDGTIDDPNKS